MSKKKMILTAILGMTACGAAFVGGNLKAMRKTRKSQEQLFRVLSEKEDEIEWLTDEIEDCEDDNDLLREQLSNANEEIHRLKDLQRGVR
jgi:septal ring factor EnvC (AmiA/AmiB activator)